MILYLKLIQIYSTLENLAIELGSNN